MAAGRPKKRRKTHHDLNEQPRINKNGLLKALEDVADEIKKRGKDEDTALGERLKDLRLQVEVVLQEGNDELKRLHNEIIDLKKEVEEIKYKNDELNHKNEKLSKKLALAQATWIWEAHLARFVVDEKTIYEFRRYGQMTHHLKKVKAKDNLWNKLQNNIGRWTRPHWDMVNAVRKERNGIVHPELIDLDIVESEITKMVPENRKRMRNMLEILKMTASLMKFGRLATFYKENKDLFPSLRLRGSEVDALEYIISWNRHFEDIEGLQNIEHEEAKKYLEKYVDDRRMINHYFFIVDSIKKANSKGMGKLAWEFAERYPFTRRMTNESEALHRLQKLVKKSDRNVTVLNPTIAKLHIPDFLPKCLWEEGIKIVKKYSELPRRK